MLVSTSCGLQETERAARAEDERRRARCRQALRRETDAMLRGEQSTRRYYEGLGNWHEPTGEQLLPCADQLPAAVDRRQDGVPALEPRPPLEPRPAPVTPGRRRPGQTAAAARPGHDAALRD